VGASHGAFEITDPSCQSLATALNPPAQVNRCVLLVVFLEP